MVDRVEDIYIKEALEFTGGSKIILVHLVFYRRRDFGSKSVSIV